MGKRPTHGQDLTEKEYDVLLMLAEGFTNNEIASQANVAASTIQQRAFDVVTKLGARNRTHAVAVAYHTGVLRSPRCSCTKQAGEEPATPGRRPAA